MVFLERAVNVCTAPLTFPVSFPRHLFHLAVLELCPFIINQISSKQTLPEVYEFLAKYQIEGGHQGNLKPVTQKHLELGIGV